MKAPFSDKLRMARESKNMTQAELARQAGLSRAAICRYESGERTNISRAIISRLANIVGFSVMTNREALMEELDALDDATFEYMLLSRNSDLPETLEAVKCEDCKKEHGGSCPLDDDDDSCVLKLTDWLSQTCTHEKLIREVTE